MFFGEKEDHSLLTNNCIGDTIRIGREIQCLLYAGFFLQACLFWLSLAFPGHMSQTNQTMPKYIVYESALIVNADIYILNKNP